nr:putative ribonuclease H-like domain-containing protein [Tanacetum cinerariifolium]
PPAQVYSPTKTDMTWTGLPEFANDAITDYSRPSSSIESNSSDLQNSNSSVSENGESSESIISKPMIKFIKAADSPTVIKTNKVETIRKPSVKYAKMYRNTTKSPKVREYIVLGRNFKVKDDTNVLLRTPRQHNMYSIDLDNIVPYKDLTCLVAKASTDESMLWHRRLGHLNYKTLNKLVRHNLVKGLPSKCFENDHTYVAFLKGKQHKASCKTKLVNSVSSPLHTLHIDLFGPTSVSSLNHKWYCLVVNDDFSRFTWTFFLKTKDETTGILRNFITEIENLKYLKVKIIRCDNRGEFKNKEINEFCTRKGIKREFSNAMTLQQNGVAERRNKTPIEAARTMLANAKLPVTFWAKAVNTACYVQNRVLVYNSQNKTPYELFNGRTPSIGFLKPFGCHVMILNTLDHLGKFDAKGDEGYFISKYKTARELWAVILKTFGGNEATKKTKKNLLKQQYGNFKAGGLENLEQTFTRLQVIVGQLQFMDVEIEQDDLNQKFLTSLAPEWLMHTIVWRNMSDLDTMSLDDLYNNLKVYESEVQKKSEPNSQNMAFISSTKHNSGNEDGNTACVPTASANVPTASASVATISQDTACAYIASQSSGSQIKFEDINQIDEDDMEKMDIKWNMALLSMRADKF